MYFMSLLSSSSNFHTASHLLRSPQAAGNKDAQKAGVLLGRAVAFLAVAEQGGPLGSHQMGNLREGHPPQARREPWWDGQEPRCEEGRQGCGTACRQV